MSSSRPSLYVDYNASTPIAPEVAAMMREAMEGAFGNPSSAHWAGVPARRMVEEARRQVADFLGCAAQEVVFTSGGSEANNFALKGAFFASGRARRHFITTQVEHPAIVAPLGFLERLGASVTWLPVDGTGRIDPDDLRRAVTGDTILISIMHANNEVGTIQPVGHWTGHTSRWMGLSPHRPLSLRGAGPAVRCRRLYGRCVLRGLVAFSARSARS